jgi:hypothetical protein
LYVFIFYIIYFAEAFKAFAKLDFLLAAVFLCNKFFAAALSIDLTALFTISLAAASFDAMASLHFFIEVFNADFVAKLFAVLVFVTFTLFIADLIFGKLFTSCELINIEYFTMKEIKTQGNLRLLFTKKYF